ncbi:aromatic-ring-hydroxylating dioxygenase subunit beta [Sphingomonas canadensis]|uniref:Aromatic-ring-hydroxylating dioxygenase subunit beta n=1 Tax=Sphingomonas canadensis TaxID=1219257 RepID=A0ABW3H8Y2_9SPHN|nr:aromatic-ring-hydroxylating dioxygenase subunit beta [Sphingomonas canadensis]MCW3837632.1 aromatic-ring-hydroxylating dioxygenase subunit beta [Sphingomonas canadensis]
MTVQPISRADAEALLYREAELLDEGDWDGWLAMYTADALFWMPAWRDEETPTADPDRELSLIYYSGRAGLEDRVYRARSGQSVASRPRPRCLHCISNVRVISAGAAEAEVASAFVVHLHDVRAARTHQFFGRYRHTLRLEDGGWRIAAKKILLLNDTIPTVVDFYSI